MHLFELLFAAAPDALPNPEPATEPIGPIGPPLKELIGAIGAGLIIGPPGKPPPACCSPPTALSTFFTSVTSPFGWSGFVTTNEVNSVTKLY